MGEPRKVMPWFRFYSEATTDKKLKRVARLADVRFTEVLGVWCIVLSVASESPIRGTLLVSADMPVEDADISELAGQDVSETLQQLRSNGLITVSDGVMSIPNWHKRQYESDLSTPRVQKFRAKTKEETGMKRFSNVSETPPDNRQQITETETETEQQQHALAAISRSVVVVALARAGILSSSHDAILSVNPALTPEDVDAFAEYVKRTNTTRNGNPLTPAWIVSELKAGHRAPEDCYLPPPDPDAQKFVLE